MFAFCRLFLRQPLKAEEATKAAFLAYLERDLALDLTKMPDDLLRFAWEASRCHGEFPPKPSRPSRRFREAILSLPAEERAIFILTCVMDLDELDVGTILECPVQKVHATRTQALQELRATSGNQFFGKRLNAAPTQAEMRELG